MNKCAICSAHGKSPEGAILGLLSVRKATALAAEANMQAEHWIRMGEASLTLDPKTKQLIALAVHNDNPNEAATAALAVCKRLAKEDNK